MPGTKISIPLPCYLFALFGVIASNHDASAMYEYQSTIADWEISGEFVVEAGQKPPTIGELKWQMLRLQDSPWHRNVPVLANIEVDAKGAFRIAPKDKALKFYWIGPHRYVLGFYWEGRLATSDPFEVKDAPFRLHGLRIKFGPQHTRVLRARIVDHETGIGRPKEKMNAYLPEETCGALGLGNLTIAEVITDEHGILRLDNAPEGKIGLVPTLGNRLKTALADGIWVEGKIEIISLPIGEADKLQIDLLPQIYQIEQGKGMIWDAFYVNDPETQLRCMAKDTILEFSAKHNSDDSPFWNEKLTFQVTVGEQGLVKTPVVPEGRYTIRTVKGDQCGQNEWHIKGMGSIHSSSRHDVLLDKKKPWIECPNALLLPAPGMQQKVFCSALQPLRIRIRNTGWTGHLKLVSAKYPAALDTTKDLEGEWVEFSLDYKAQQSSDEPDLITITALPSRGPTNKIICELKVHPLSVQLESTHARLDSMTGWFSVPGEFKNEQFEGRDKFKYVVRPWDPILKEHLYFAALPPYYCSAAIAFSITSPTAKSGEVEIRIEAKPPGVGAITTMLGKELWQECCTRRIPISFLFIGDKPNQGLVAPPLNPEDANAVDRALDDMYPEPRDQQTKVRLQKLREMLHQHGVPHLAPALRSFTKEYRDDIIKYSGLSWEELIMGFAAQAIRFAPPPPKPSKAAVEK